MQKFIVHVDMDAFFAAIEQRDNPKLRGEPVIIGADPKNGKGRGVVSTCSYEARKFGVHSAMPISIAFRRCPQGIFLPVDMRKYAQVSENICKIFYEFTPKVEIASIDEAFLDITASYHLFGGPRKTCVLLKSQIKEKTGLTASVGIAPTKMAAKIASDINKPDGLVEVTQEGLIDFIRPLDISKIWGLGKKSKEALNNIGIRTIGELAKIDLKRLINIFGRNGEYFWKLANGVDKREVVMEEEAKSISNEYTFDEDISDKEKVKAALAGLCEKVSGSLRYEGIKGRTITLKLRLEGFQTYTRAKTIIKAANFVDVIYKTIEILFEDFDLKGKKIRLVGVKVSNLMSQEVNDTLFNDQIDKKREKIHKATDKIKEKFGKGAIRRAAGMQFKCEKSDS